MIIPAVSGLQFLRTDIVFCITLPKIHDFIGSHQAGVESYQIELGIAGKDRPVHGILHFIQKKRIRIKKLVRTITPERAAAMIPENQRIVLCRKISGGKVDKFLKSLPGTHISIGLCRGDHIIRPRQ